MDGQPIMSTVRCVYGPLIKEVAAVPGLTVRGLFRALRDPFGIPSEAELLVNGHPAGDDQKLVAGDTFEAVRRAGEKGV